MSYVRDAGQWKEIKALHVRDGGQWKEVKGAWVRDGGEWKLFFAVPPSDAPTGIFATLSGTGDLHVTWNNDPKYKTNIEGRGLWFGSPIDAFGPDQVAADVGFYNTTVDPQWDWEVQLWYEDDDGNTGNKSAWILAAQ